MTHTPRSESAPEHYEFTDAIKRELASPRDSQRLLNENRHVIGDVMDAQSPEAQSQKQIDILKRFVKTGPISEKRWNMYKTDFQEKNSDRWMDKDEIIALLENMVRNPADQKPGKKEEILDFYISHSAEEKKALKRLKSKDALDKGKYSLNFVFHKDGKIAILSEKEYRDFMNVILNTLDLPIRENRGQTRAYIPHLLKAEDFADEQESGYEEYLRMIALESA